MADAFHQLYLNFALMGIQRLWVRFQKKKKKDIKMIALLWIEPIYQISTYSHCLYLSCKKNKGKNLALLFVVVVRFWFSCDCATSTVCGFIQTSPMGSDPGELAVEGAATSKQSGHGFRKWDLNVRSLRAGQAAESCVRVQSTPQVRTEAFFKFKKKKKRRGERKK